MSELIENKLFPTWAIVEVMGHKRFAGLVSEQTVAGAAMVRVDVPAIDESVSGASGVPLPPFTKLIGVASIYALTPCTEETAKAFAAKLQERAFNTYEAPRLGVASTARPGVDYFPDEYSQEDARDDD